MKVNLEPVQLGGTAQTKRQDVVPVAASDGAVGADGEEAPSDVEEEQEEEDFDAMD